MGNILRSALESNSIKEEILNLNPATENWAEVLVAIVNAISFVSLIRNLEDTYDLLVTIKAKLHYYNGVDKYSLIESINKSLYNIKRVISELQEQSRKVQRLEDTAKQLQERNQRLESDIRKLNSQNTTKISDLEDKHALEIEKLEFEIEKLKEENRKLKRKPKPVK